MRKRKIHIFTIADFEEEEIWLRKQHQNGLKLVKTVSPCFYVFEETSPEDVIYRLDYHNEAAEDDDLQLFRDYGWEYLSAMDGWRYFCKPSAEVLTENAGEIFPDSQSKQKIIRRLMKTRMLPLLVLFFCCVLPAFFNMISLSCSSPFIVCLGVLSFILTLLYLLIFLHCGIKLRKLRRKYEQE